MSFKKNILIIGPIGDFGGREIMTNLLVDSLKDTYDVDLLSTISMTNKSSALGGGGHASWSTINYFLFRCNIVLRLTALLTKFMHRRKEPAYFFIKNRITKPYFDFNKLYYSSIEKFILKADLIIHSNEINGKWLKDIIELSDKLKKPLLIRITGEVKSMPNYLSYTKTNFSILSHSKQNTNRLNDCLGQKVNHVDQTTAIEKDLINIEIKEKENLVYGFLGRFSEEKGIKQLVKTFSKCGKRLLIAGNGPLLLEVENACENNKNISYLGQFLPSELWSFFNKIDVFVICSFEEGGPLVGIEAMAAGKLIISTNVGAMPERLNQTGNDFWINHDIKDSLEKSINNVEKLNKNQRLKVRQMVRQRYIDCNAFDVIKQEYLNLVEGIIN